MKEILKQEESCFEVDFALDNIVDDIVDKYKNSISGILGKFTEQCRQSVSCNKQGIKVQAQRAGTGWDKKLKSKITAYVKDKIFSKQRMFKKSFSNHRFCPISAYNLFCLNIFLFPIHINNKIK